MLSISTQLNIYGRVSQQTHTYRHRFSNHDVDINNTYIYKTFFILLYSDDFSNIFSFFWTMWLIVYNWCVEDSGGFFLTPSGLISLSRAAQWFFKHNCHENDSKQYIFVLEIKPKVCNTLNLGHYILCLSFLFCFVFFFQLCLYNVSYSVATKRLPMVGQCIISKSHLWVFHDQNLQNVQFLGLKTAKKVVLHPKSH